MDIPGDELERLEEGKIAERERVLKRDKGNFDLKRGERK